MKLYHSFRPLPPEVEKTVVTIGFFDGVHLGHQSLIHRVKDLARSQGAASVILTFEDHPSSVIAPHKNPSCLTTAAERLEMIKTIGVNYLAMIPFTEDLANYSAEQFCQGILRDCYRAQTLLVGPDFSLGKGREGTFERLIILGKRLGFTVLRADPLIMDKEIVSSTLIRNLIRRGSVSRAARLLGRPYVLSGIIVTGKGLGRKLGFPTLNLEPQKCKVIPGSGVYLAEVLIGGQTVPAVGNIGYSPTVGDGIRRVEFHLLEFSEEMNAKVTGVALLERLRGEQKFADLGELKTAIGSDVDYARQWFAKRRSTCH